MNWWDTFINAMVVGGVTALATGFVNGKIMQAHLTDLTNRVSRIEHYLNGLLDKFKDTRA